MLLQGMMNPSRRTDFADKNGKAVEQVSFAIYDLTLGMAECSCAPNVQLPAAGLSVEAIVNRVSRGLNGPKFVVASVKPLNGFSSLLPFDSSTPPASEQKRK